MRAERERVRMEVGKAAIGMTDLFWGLVWVFRCFLLRS